MHRVQNFSLTYLYYWQNAHNKKTLQKMLLRLWIFTTRRRIRHRPMAGHVHWSRII